MDNELKDVHRDRIGQSDQPYREIYQQLHQFARETPGVQPGEG